MDETHDATFQTLLALASPAQAADETLGGSQTTMGGEGRSEASEMSAALPEGYEARQPLGSGAVGEVWLATESALARDVALKVLHQGATQAAHASLLAEARVLAKLEHAAIPPVYALGSEAGTPFVAMRRIPGVSAKELAGAPAHPLWVEWSMGTGDRFVAIVEILARVAEALAHAHDRGLIHRDVKPANIMVGSLGQAFLVDWGLALPVGSIGSRAVAGTPGFIAPEMVSGGPLDERTDVFLLGATLHSMLTGRMRHAGATVDQVLSAALVCAPIAYPDDLPPVLARLANDATAREPGARPATALVFRERLREYRRDRMAEGFVASAAAPLSALEQLVGRLEPEVLPEAERLASVCRFVYGQAAALSAESDVAVTGRSRVASAVARFYLARGESGPARAALAEVAEPEQSALAARLVELEGQQTRDAERVDSLRKALSEHDPAIEARGRPWLTIAFGVAVSTAILAGRLITSGRPQEATSLRGIWVSAGLAFVVLATVVAYWRRIARSRPNVVFATLVVTLTSGRFAVRLLDKAQGVGSLEPAFARDLVWFACLSLLGGVATRLGVYGYLAAVFSCGALASALWPASTMLISDLTNVAGLAGAAGFAVWMARAAAEAPSA
jgi:eukaryotic-like serine/threonine-protein kinase